MNTKANQPEKIYNWLYGQLSIARFFGGITYNGAQYYIDETQEGAPLVRHDVFKRSQKNQARAATSHKR